MRTLGWAVLCNVLITIPRAVREATMAGKASAQPTPSLHVQQLLLSTKALPLASIRLCCLIPRATTGCLRATQACTRPFMPIIKWVFGVFLDNSCR